jgi:predicted transcriptional regulator
MTTLHITVGDRERVREDALQFVQAAETDTLDDQDGVAILQFGTYDEHPSPP